MVIEKQKSDNFTHADKPRLENRRIKVLHIIKSLGRGGAEMLLPATLAYHDRNKFEFHYIYFLPWKNQVAEEIEANGGKVYCFAASNNLHIILKARRIARYIREQGIALIHCHLPWAGIVGRIAGILAKTPVIYTEHNKWERYHKLTFILNKLSFPWQEKVIAVSGDVAQSIKTFYKKNDPEIYTVENGIDTEKFSRHNSYDRDIRNELKIDAHAKVIGIVSVFRIQKRLPHWLEIATEIHRQYPGTRFIIVGDGPLRKQVYQKAEALKMEGYLYFAGLQTEVRPYLKAMDIFMMTSEFEGLPLALLEAMSMECIPVCTNAGGVGEIIQNENNGFLVDVNKLQEICGNISGLFENWDCTGLMAKHARVTVTEKFSIRNMVTSLEKIYAACSIPLNEYP